MQLDEPAARRLLLVQAIEAADAGGRILSAAERDRIERDAWQVAPGTEAYLQERSRRVMAAIAPRDSRIATIEQAHAWQPLLAWLLPLLGFATGALLDRIDNPHQVNMLSPPLLLFLAWNFAVYAALVVLPHLKRRRTRPSHSAAWLGEALARIASGRARAGLRASVAAQFRALWWRVAGEVETWRLQQVLHGAAAAWAAGVAVSIIVGGLVREYRVGWESTLLDAPQVHAALRVIFAPVVALTPLDGFSLADIDRMHFRSGEVLARAEARHWVALYVGLLVVAVIVPRGVLAIFAGWRARRAARALQVDIQQPYFAEVLSRVGLRLIAKFLLEAVRDQEEVKAAPLSIKRLVSASERDASEQAREEAMGRLLQRVEQRLSATMHELALLHGRHAAPIASALAPASRGFIVREPVDTSEAGVAGAAAGVAAGALAGAKIDVLTAGMTMGAATLIGALLGGTGALTAARWLNRTSPQGVATVQLGDEILDALAADALLRYARMLHPAAEPTSAKLDAHADLWSAAREGDFEEATLDIVDALQARLASMRAAEPSPAI